MALKVLKNKNSADGINFDVMWKDFRKKKEVEIDGVDHVKKNI